MSSYALQQAERARISRARQAKPVTDHRHAGALLVSAFVLLSAALLALLDGVGGLSPWVCAMYVLTIALASRFRFDVGAGFTVPTQAVFVPMLFAVPLPVVPIVVAAGLALGMLPDVLSGRAAPGRLVTSLANSAFSVGPCVVLAVAGVHGPEGHWGVLLLALAAQFLCDFVANAAVENTLHDISVATLLEEFREVYTIDLALAPLGLALAVAAAALDSQAAVLLVIPQFGLLSMLSRERSDRLDQLIELNDAYQGTALLLGDVVEADDAYTGEHCKGVVRVAVDVAKRLGLDLDEQRKVEFGALLHDVGKIAVPNEIINKPGKLDDDEWAIIKTHTLEGERMLATVGGFMGEVGKVVRSSHESWDGSGYPDGLRGEAIPIEARIVSTCDAFDAMTTTRSYRKAMPTADAVAELRRNAGVQFDPAVVQALIEATEEPARQTSPGAPSRRP